MPPKSNKHKKSGSVVLDKKPAGPVEKINGALKADGKSASQDKNSDKHDKKKKLGSDPGSEGPESGGEKSGDDSGEESGGGESGKEESGDSEHSKSGDSGEEPESEEEKEPKKKQKDDKKHEVGGKASHGSEGESESEGEEGGDKKQKVFDGKALIVQWLKQNAPNLTTKDRRKLELKAPKLLKSYESKYLDIGSWSPKSQTLDCAVALNGAAWKTLIDLNKIMYGFEVRDVEKDVVKARSKAFKLRVAVKDRLPIPAYEVSDSSNITIIEIKTDLQRSLAENGFSENSIQTAIGGGTVGISAGVSAGLKVESSSGKGDSTGTSKKEYYATYNFPRAKVFLDHRNLKISNELKLAIENIRKTPNYSNLVQLSKDFGHVFATTVELGGRLQSTKFAESSFGESESEQRDSLKVAVGANFSNPYVTASAKYGNETQRSKTGGEKKLSDQSSLSWTARGGDTLLCANPPLWAGSIGPYKNWRVIGQETITTLYQLIGEFKGYEDIPKLFADIANNRIPDPVTAGPIVPKTFDTTAPWKNQVALMIDDGYVVLQSSEESFFTVAPVTKERPTGTAFTVLNGDTTDTRAEPLLLGLYAEYPLLLIYGDKYSKASGQFDTVNVSASTGELRPQTTNVGAYRFSFRTVGRTGQWQAKVSELKNGAKVEMYCHSLGIGPYGTTTSPPSTGARAFYNKETRNVLFQTNQVSVEKLKQDGFEEATVTVEYL